MEVKDDQKEIVIQPSRDDCDTSKLEESESSSHEKIQHSTIRPAFICTSLLTIILPILWFIISGMASWGDNGYNNLWWVHLLGGDSVSDTQNGRGITILLSFGWAFGLFLVFFIQGMNILRGIYGDVDIRNRRLTCCLSKLKRKEQTVKPQGVDERKIGILIGCLFCFSNLCIVLCLSIAWPTVRALLNSFTILV